MILFVTAALSVECFCYVIQDISNSLRDREAEAQNWLKNENDKCS